MQLARVITKRSKHRHQVSWPYRHTTQELASAEQDSPEAVGRRLSKHFTTDCRDLVFKATAALRAATKLGIACPDGQIPLVESLVSSGAVTNEENSSKQEVSAVLETSRTTNSTIVVPSRQAHLLYSCMQTTPATSAGDAQTSTAASSCSTTESGVDTQSASSPLATAVLASPEPEFAPYRLGRTSPLRVGEWHEYVRNHHQGCEATSPTTHATRFKFKLLSGMRSILGEDYLVSEFARA